MSQNCLDEIISLADAADELSLAASTLRTQVKRGSLNAIVLGKTWITTKAEVARYRRDHLGKPGRPAVLLERIADLEEPRKRRISALEAQRRQRATEAIEGARATRSARKG